MLGFLSCISMKYGIIKKGKIMKILFNILVVLSLFLLLGAALGRFVGRPQIMIGLRVANLILVANTTLLLAIIVKLFEKNKLS